MEEALPTALLTLGHAISNANVGTAEEVWRVVLETAQQQLADLHQRQAEKEAPPAAGKLRPGTTPTTALQDLRGTLMHLFLVTCYDIFSLAKCYRQAPWNIGTSLSSAQRRAVKRCNALKRLSNPTVKYRGGTNDAASSTTGEDDDDDYCDELPDIFDRMPAAFRRGPRCSVRSDTAIFEPLPVFKKSADDKVSIEKAMDTSFVFEAFSEEQELRNRLIDALKPVEVAKSSVVMSEGDSGDGLYVIVRGQVELTRGGQVLKELRAGDLFGELAVLHACSRTYSARVTSNECLLYFLDRRSYQSLVNSKQREALSPTSIQR